MRGTAARAFTDTIFETVGMQAIVGCLFVNTTIILNPHAIFVACGSRVTGTGLAMVARVFVGRWGYL